MGSEMCIRDRVLFNWRFWLAAIAWILLVVAAARPEHVGDELEVPVSGRNLMLAVDLSGSMDQKDFVLGTTRVDRLTATKAVAIDLISRREGDRIGSVPYTTPQPATEDEAIEGGGTFRGGAVAATPWAERERQ